MTGDAGFITRGVVLSREDVESWDWPGQAKRAGLSTLGLHVGPAEVLKSGGLDPDGGFARRCREAGLNVEYELHAVGELLPRDLFARDPSLFRMDDEGRRTADANLCVHSEKAVGIVCENARIYANRLPSSTGRYFFWMDDGRPVCRCPACREYTPSELALMVENRMIEALRRDKPAAKLGHLAYLNTLAPPRRVKPREGIFLEFAPIQRGYDRPLGDRSARGPEEMGSMTHGELVDLLDANLAVFGAAGAQALEYWLDVSRFASWKRERIGAIPWNDEVFQDDLRAYATRGIRHVTSFAVWLDGNYVARFGHPPLDEYGYGLVKTEALPQER